jgi:protein-disulfide isomerase
MVVIGDRADNQIEISQDSARNFVVTGLDTTVNGATDPVVVRRGFTHLTVVLHDGNDEVFVSDISLPSNFSFHGGNGNDRLQTSGLTAYHLHAEGQAGDDVFELDMNIDQSSYLYLGTGDDVVALSAVTSGRNLKIFGHGGDDTIATDGLQVGRKLEVYLHEGNDSVLMQGHVSVGRYTVISTDTGNDFTGLLPARDGGRADFGSRLSVFTGSGSDQLALDRGVSFRGFFRADGGADVDSIQRGAAGFRGDRITSFENTSVSNLNRLIDNVISRLEEVGIGEETPIVPLEATASSSLLQYTEGSGPVPVDAGFRLQGSGLVTGATIQISDFASDQDELSFNGTGLISGTFNPASGILQLTGNTTAANYQQALRSVTYQNTSNSPVTTLRRFDFRITTDDESAEAIREFQVVAVNQAPVIVPGRTEVTVVAEDLPVVIDEQLSVEDADNDNLVSGSVQIVSGLQNGDVLSVQDQGGISSSYDPVTGTLTLAGEATVAQWQSLLRTVTFDTERPGIPTGVRTIRFTVSDGQDSGSADVNVDLQNDNLPSNNFLVSTSDTNGTVLGRVVTEGDFGTQIVYQFNDDQVPAEILLNADDHIDGQPDAAVVLIEYLSYQCPACAVNHPLIRQLQSDFPEDLIVVHRHQTLEQFFSNARPAAIAAEAAARQGRFEEMTDLLLENQSEWSPVVDPTALFESYASELNLDLNQFRSDVQDPALDARVSRDREEANGLGITSTPSFILQNQPFPNPGTQQGFNDAVQQAIDDLDNPFSIDRDTGDIILRDNSLLDPVNRPVVSLPVLVKDTLGNSELVQVTIAVVQ